MKNQRSSTLSMLALAAATTAVALASTGCTFWQPGVARAAAPVQSAPMSSTVDAGLTEQRLARLLPADVVLLGEQHDAAEHQQIHQQVVSSLARRGLLAALVLEMADTGASTAQLRPGTRATEAMVQQALNWNDKAWPWPAYAPAIMAAVQAGVPVVGGNLPRIEMAGVMADIRLDGQLTGPALKAQQQAIRIGHCNALPESQIAPMARIQIARDMRLAEAVAQSAVPGKVVVLLAGSAHGDKALGVPLHLPAGVQAKAVQLQAPGGSQGGNFDAVWPTLAAVPEVDYCAAFRK